MKKPALPRVGLPHLLLAVAAVLFLALTFKPAVSGDGVGYFSYLHSVIVDRDLDMSDEYAAARAAHVDVYPPQISTRTKTGMLANLFPVGPALMSAPAYVAALALRPSGAPQVDAPFTTAYTLASLLYGLLALAICYRFARAVTGSSGAALTGAVAAALTTPLLYYLVYQPSYAHTFSAFAVSAFMYLWWSTRGHRSTRAWLLLGLLGGMMALVRWQDGPLAAVALLDLPKERFRVLLLVPGIVLGFLPQLLVDHVIFGSWLPSRPGLDPLHGHYFDVLFSSWHGLFTWTPGVLLASIGIFLVRDRALRAAFVLCLAMQLFIVGAYPIWWGGFSFGMRYLVNLTPFYAIGLAALAVRLRPWVSRVAIAGLTAWSLLLILDMTYVIKVDVNPGWVGLLKDQVAALSYAPHLLQGYVVRALLLWPLLKTEPNFLGGVVVLLLLAGTVIAAWLAGAGGSGDRPQPAPAPLAVTRWPRAGTPGARN